MPPVVDNVLSVIHYDESAPVRLTITTILRLAAVIVLSGSAAAQITQNKPAPRVIEAQVNVDGNLGTVAPRMFGTFLEPIDFQLTA